MMTTAATDFYYSPPFLRPVINKFARTGQVRIWKTGSREGREVEGWEEPKSIELNPFLPIPGGRGARAFFPRGHRWVFIIPPLV